MDLFALFRKKKPAVPNLVDIDARFGTSDRTDHLGNAARAKHEAEAAVKAGRLDVAWRLLHEQKRHYLKHAQRYGMTPRQTVALDGSVHENLANILRLEGKHYDALVHMLYCVTSDTRPAKSRRKKIVAYFNRCRFAAVDLPALELFIEAESAQPDFGRIQSKVRSWKNI